MIKKIFLLPRTYRIDIFFLVLLLFIYTLFPTDDIYKNILISIFFASIPFNFIYTINILTDIKEDSINKPERTKLIKKLGFDVIVFYSVLLLIIGVVVPILFLEQRFLFLSIFVMTGGILYSLPPFRTKRFFTGNIIVLLVALSVLFYGRESYDLNFITNFIFYAFLMMAFKDINDREGDNHASVFNWFNINIPIFKMIFLLNISLVFLNLYYAQWILFTFSVINIPVINIKYIKKNYVFFVCLILTVLILSELFYDKNVGLGV